MPTYDYKCPSDHIFEVFQGINEEPAAVCPHCGKPAKRLLSAGAGLMFKGSGFYITDYKKNNGNGTKTKKKNSSDSAKETADAVKKDTADTK